MTVLLGVLVEGLIYAIMSLGVYITYKILDFPDLSVDGTFPLGGALTALMIAGGANSLWTLPVSFLVGALAGVLTGLIHVRLKVRDLLSGIIMMTALYSVNLRIAGKANLPIFSKDSIFKNAWTASWPEWLQPYTDVLLLLVMVLLCKLLLDAYLDTRSGYLLRAVGDNETLVSSLARDKGNVKILGLAIANGFAALAGCMYTQQHGFFEISMGTGTIVIGLANVIIGTQLCRHLSWIKTTSAVILGSIIYKGCVSLAISRGFSSSDLRLITAALLLLILVLSNMKKNKVKEAAGK